MDKREFARRRQRLMEQMEGGIAILPGGVEVVRNRDVAYPFRQDSDFYYLSGFPEPEAVMVLIPERKAFILFCRERDPEMETWHGRRAGTEGARTLYQADEAYPIAQIDEVLPALLENQSHIYYSLGHRPEFDERLMGWLNRVRGRVRAGVRAPHTFVSLDPLIHGMRLIKSSQEIKAMKKAAAISIDAHCQAMKACQPGMYEYQIEALMLQRFTHQGSRSPAYPSIVAGGENACILHYTENSALLKEGDLLLIDAGAEYDMYASDITRTFPVNGRYTPAQRQIYDIVLAAQKAAIDQVRPGNTWNDPHRAAVEVLTEGLLSLGLLEGRLSELIEKEAYRRFYMHRTGHWLGMDVHDVGDYKEDGGWKTLEPGMVMTVEPGLYFPKAADIPRRFWNIGVRIEDDVLVTREGHEILTEALPKEAEAVEALMMGDLTLSMVEDGG
ncbi:MAG: Xaa-Pro aminopeptidase [Gammaproteobacteria bacterium]|nr:MAG: Xaa-Pro aminopeptidase [Gammaproteobacteria bacterium]